MLMGFSMNLWATTTIHNNGFTASNQALPSKPNYGSNASAAGTNWAVSVGATGVTGTPNIQLVWDGEGGGGNGGANGGLDTYVGWNGRGNVVQIDGTGTGGTANSFISFVPAPSVAAKITSFALDAWAGWPAGGNMTVDWSIRDGTNTGTVLASGTWTRTTGGRDTVSPNYTGTVGQTLVLQLTRTAGNGDYLAMDDLVFDEITFSPKILSFTSPISVIDGDPIPLAWTISNPASIQTLTISDGSNSVDVKALTDSGTGVGEYEVNPTVSTTYTLTLDGTLTAQVNLLTGSVQTFTSNTSVAAMPGYQVTLSWQVVPPNASMVTITDGVTTYDVKADTDSGTGIGSKVFVVPSDTTIFTIEANDSGATRTLLTKREKASSADFSVSATSILFGSSITVNWANAAAGATDWVGIYPVSEIPDGNPVSTTWNYLNGTRTSGGSVPSGSMNFSGLAVGEYHAWLLLNDGYTSAQGPVRFSVVAPPPEPVIMPVLQVERVGNQFTLAWQSQTGRVYDIYASADLQGDPLVDWTKISDDYAAETDGSTSFTENLGANPPVKRFYRVYEYTAP